MNANDLILLENFKKILSNQCSPEEIIKNNQGEAIAVKCSCGNHHPILGGKILRAGEKLPDFLLFRMVETNVSYARILAEQ